MTPIESFSFVLYLFSFPFFTRFLDEKGVKVFVLTSFLLFSLFLYILATMGSTLKNMMIFTGVKWWDIRWNIRRNSVPLRLFRHCVRLNLFHDRGQLHPLYASFSSRCSRVLVLFFIVANFLPSNIWIRWEFFCLKKIW